MRTYDSGATRSSVEGKLNYIGFLSPWVLERYAQYMHKHRIQEDGKLRDAGNWKKGIDKQDYMESSFRHYMDWWFGHEGAMSKDDTEEALCALLFNVMGYLYELLKEE